MRDFFRSVRWFRRRWVFRRLRLIGGERNPSGVMFGVILPGI